MSVAILRAIVCELRPRSNAMLRARVASLRDSRALRPAWVVDLGLGGIAMCKTDARHSCCNRSAL